MMNIRSTRSRPIAALLALAGAVACGDKFNGVTAVNVVTPSGRVVVGAAEVTFTDLSHTDISAGLVLASSLTKLQQLDAAHDTVGDVGSVSFRLIAVSEFAFEPADSAPVRFIHATFAVHNATTGTPLFDPTRHNLTFEAVTTPNTIAGTSVRLLLQVNGTPASATIAQQLVPTDITAIMVDGTLTTLLPPVEVTVPDSVLSTIPLPADASHLLPFGFLVRGPADLNGLGGINGPADGVVSFAFRLPVQTPATNDASTMSVLFLLVNNTNATATP